MRLLPYGRDAVLVETDEPPAAAWRRLLATGDDAIAEAVPAARTLLVRFVPGRPRPDLAVLMGEPGDERAVPPGRAPVELAIRYDGADLDEVADRTGLSREAVVRRHSGASYTVAFCGFAPGFAYLSGLPPELHVARHDEPRTRVPAGAVGIAGEYTGVYPRPSPGGWRLLGHTATTLWDSELDPPALLTPGRRVRFVEA